MQHEITEILGAIVLISFAIVLIAFIGSLPFAFLGFITLSIMNIFQIGVVISYINSFIVGIGIVMIASFFSK